MPEVGELYGCLTPLYWDGSKWVKHAKVPAEAIADGAITKDKLAAGAIPAALEEDYTTWTIQAIYDTGVAETGDDPLGVTNDGKIIFNDASAQETYIIDSDGTLLHTLTDQYPGQSWWGETSSLLNKYSLIRDVSTGHVVNVITADGTLWSRNLDDDRGAHVLADGNIRRFSISQNGKWILAMIRDNLGHTLIFIYKGAA